MMAIFLRCCNCNTISMHIYRIPQFTGPQFLSLNSPSKVAVTIELPTWMAGNSNLIAEGGCTFYAPRASPPPSLPQQQAERCPSAVDLVG